MNKEEKMLVRFVCEDAYLNKDENPYEVYSTLSECYSSYSSAKEKAYNDCEHKFSENVNYFFDSKLINEVITFSRIVSHNQMMFTLLQCAYYFSEDGSLVALFRYDTKTRSYIRAFKLSKDGFDFKKSVSDIAKLIEVNK